MTFDSRWKNPQGSDPKQLHLWAQETIRELRKGGFLGGLTDLAATLFATINVQSFTTPGANSYTATADLLYALVISTGAGGGGGGADSDGSSFAGGAGGSAGGTCIELFTAAQIGAGQTVTIGTGGTAGAATGTNGGNGGDTTFGSLHTAGGGPGGTGIAGTTEHVVAPSAGGTATGGLVNIVGGEGDAGWGDSGGGMAIGGRGGGSFWGGGAGSTAVIATGTVQAGRNASAPGSGGSGGANRDTTDGTTGGTGAGGICIVIEFIGGATP